MGQKGMSHTEEIRRLAFARWPGSSIRVARRNFIQATGPHWHDYYEMILFCRGRAQSNVNGTVLPLEPGTLYLVTPVDVHDTVALSDAVEYVNISFTEAMVDRGLLAALHGAHSMQGALPGCMVHTLVRLMEECGDAGTWKLEEKRFLLNALLAGLLEAGSMLREGTDGLRVNETVRKTIRYVANHFEEPLDLKSVAEVMGLSPAYFSQVFSRGAGISFVRYLNEYRLGAAAELLRQTNRTVTEIAYASGFASLAHFLRLFKRKYGRSPGAFRKTE